MKKFLAIALVLLPAVAQADGSIGVRAGSMGLGVELAYPISQSMGVRLIADGYKYSRKFTQDNIDYDGDAKLRTGSLLLDIFPFANNFRISAGGVYNGNKLLLSTPNTNLTINGNPYTATLDGEVDFKKFAPYAGIGYGRPINAGLSLTFDLGVMFQGTPTATLNGTCTPAPACTAQFKIKDFRYYPVATIGLAYTF
jgi:hypothetical protein